MRPSFIAGVYAVSAVLGGVGAELSQCSWSRFAMHAVEEKIFREKIFWLARRRCWGSRLWYWPWAAVMLLGVREVVQAIAGSEDFYDWGKDFRDGGRREKRGGKMECGARFRVVKSVSGDLVVVEIMQLPS